MGPLGANTCRVEVSPGVRLNVLRWEGPDVSCLLIHGYGDHARVWDGLVASLDGFRQIFAVDLRGHGESDWDPERSYRFKTLVSDLDAVLDHLGPTAAVVVGHSLGARLAISVASRRGKLLTGLVLVDGGPGVHPHSSGQVIAEVKAMHQHYATVQEYADRIALRFPTAERREIETFASHGLRRRADGRFEPKYDPAFRLDPATVPAPSALWSALENVSCPTLIIRGAGSSVLSAVTAARMADALGAKGALCTIRSAGHSPMVDRPDDVAAALRQFLKHLPTGPLSHPASPQRP